MSKKSNIFQDVEQLKEFISWAKSQRVSKVRVLDVEVEFSALAFIDEVAPMPNLNNATSNIASLPDIPENEEELLYHSSGG
ncbi:MAG: hypothetical protein FMNOHCHN_03728 [Ignavibacteriaceae bacterium]|nr:hypothetical protein [Ignavibacteriaceae bacterium]